MVLHYYIPLNTEIKKGKAKFFDSLAHRRNYMLIDIEGINFHVKSGYVKDLSPKNLFIPHNPTILEKFFNIHRYFSLKEFKEILKEKKGINIEERLNKLKSTKKDMELEEVLSDP